MEYIIETRVFRVAGILPDGSPDEVSVYTTRRVSDTLKAVDIFSDISQKSQDAMDEDEDTLQNNCGHDWDEHQCMICGYTSYEEAMDFTEMYEDEYSRLT